MSRKPSSFQMIVADLMRDEGLDHETAWAESKRRHKFTSYAAMAANETLPGDSQVTKAGALVKDSWPVRPEILTSLGLPVAASEQQYRVAKLADTVDPTTLPPEVIAKAIMIACQLRQLQGVGFSEVWKSIRADFPDLYRLLPGDIRGASDTPATPMAQQAANVRSAAQSKAGQQITAAVNERRERFPNEPYEESFRVVKRRRPELFLEAVQMT